MGQGRACHRNETDSRRGRASRGQQQRTECTVLVTGTFPCQRDATAASRRRGDRVLQFVAYQLEWSRLFDAVPIRKAGTLDLENKDTVIDRIGPEVGHSGCHNCFRSSAVALLRLFDATLGTGEIMVKA
jgi:hypothetical protein